MRTTYPYSYSDITELAVTAWAESDDDPSVVEDAMIEMKEKYDDLIDSLRRRIYELESMASDRL